MDRTLFIVNPTSGSGRGRSATAVVREILAQSNAVDTAMTTARGDAETAAKDAASSGYRQVVVAGGDGTINEVVNGLAATDVACGIIPVGTANVLARELDLPINDPAAAAKIVLNGSTRRIDLGLADSRCFAAMAGFGFDAAVVHRVEPRLKDVIGPGAYVLAIAHELVRHHPSRFVLETEDGIVESDAFMVIVANTASYAYGVQVAPGASVDSGRLEVIVFEKARPARIGLLHQAAKVLLHTHTDDANVISFACSKLTVRAEPEVLIQVDGDVIGSTPTNVQIVPGSLSVIVPE